MDIGRGEREDTSALKQSTLTINQKNKDVSQQKTLGACDHHPGGCRLWDRHCTHTLLHVNVGKTALFGL